MQVLLLLLLPPLEAAPAAVVPYSAA